MMDEKNVPLTDAQRLTLDQRIYSLDQLQQANDAMDRKSMNLLQLTSLILILLVSFTPFENILLILLFPLVIVLTICTLIPKMTFHPGTDDWETLYADYINQDTNTCFDQILSDCVETNTKVLAINKRKSGIVQIAAILFCVQMIGVGIIV